MFVLVLWCFIGWLFGVGGLCAHLGEFVRLLEFGCLDLGFEFELVVLGNVCGFG